jgi:hypothetical protein
VIWPRSFFVVCAPVCVSSASKEEAATAQAAATSVAALTLATVR